MNLTTRARTGCYGLPRLSLGAPPAFVAKQTGIPLAFRCEVGPLAIATTPEHQAPM